MPGNPFDKFDASGSAGAGAAVPANPFDAYDGGKGAPSGSGAQASATPFAPSKPGNPFAEAGSRLTRPGGLWDDLVQHFTARSPELDQKPRFKPLPKDASFIDKVVHAIAPEPIVTPKQGEALQRADRLSSLSVPVRLVEEPVRGFLEGLGVDPGVVDMGEMALSYGAGARGLRAMGAMKPKPGAVLPPSGIERRVGAALDAALTQDSVEPAAFVSKLAKGVPPVAAGGPQLADLGAVAARAGGRSQQALSKAVNARAAEAPERIMGTLQEKLGVDPEAARGDMASVLARGRAAADPLFTAIRNDESVLPDSPELTSILKTPAGQEALRAAVTTLRNKREDPLNYGFELTQAPVEGPEGRLLMMPGTELVTLKSLSPRALDLVRREANSLVKRDRGTSRVTPDSDAPGNSGKNQVALDLTKVLAGDETTPGLVPTLRDALNVSGEYLAPTETFARNRGALFGTRVAEFERRWNAARGDVEKDAIRAALANDVREAYEKKGALDPGAFSTPGVRAKLELAFGKDASDAFLADMEEHASELDALGRVQGGIRSAQREGAKGLVQTDKPTKALSTGEVYHIMTSPKTGVIASVLSRLKVDPSIAANPRAMELLANAMHDPKEMARLLAISRSGSVAQRAAARRLRAP